MVKRQKDNKKFAFLPEIIIGAVLLVLGVILSLAKVNLGIGSFIISGASYLIFGPIRNYIEQRKSIGTLVVF